MITDSLFESVLIDPVQQGADTLCVVSGYASATMAARHLKHLRRSIKIELIVGMTVQDGLSQVNHHGFKALAAGTRWPNFSCRYVVYRPQVHAKVYAWFAHDEPVIGFTGSANYTQMGFSSSQREALAPLSPQEGRDYFDLVRQDTLDCQDPRVPNLIRIHDEPSYSIRTSVELPEPELESTMAETVTQLPSMRVSLINRDGIVSEKSGLNWGQRPEYSRDTNQTYIAVSAKIGRSGVLPPRAEHFSIITDDSKTLICVRQQDGGKAIATPHNNSLLGAYFRYRMNMSSGSFITKSDLANYGRTDVIFYKINDETYFMDFSV